MIYFAHPGEDDFGGLENGKCDLFLPVQNLFLLIISIDKASLPPPPFLQRKKGTEGHLICRTLHKSL